MAVIMQDGRLTLTGYVGEHWAWGDEIIIDGFTHPMVLAALSEIDDDAPLTVHLNSGGGYAVEGVAIHSALSQRSGRTDVVIDGEACSSASIVAMAGETISMSSGAMMMIHDPSGVTFGTVADHEAAIRALDNLANSYARIYSRRAGKTVEEARDIMRAETWFGDQDAVDAGFANAVLGDKRQPVAAFPFQIYAHAPREMVAQAKQNDWRLPAARPAATAAAPAAPPAPTSPKETPMADKTAADDKAAKAPDIDAERKTAAAEAVAADRKRRASIMALDEARGREALASYFADETDDTVEKVQKALAAAPEAKADEPDPDTDAAAYEASRVNGVGLGGKPKAAQKGDRTAMSDAVARVNKRR